jgi:DNA-binding transcriptional LysR family regulator
MTALYELKEVRNFVMVARAGSISRAAIEFNVPKATISHHLRSLEDALEVELFIRQPRGLTLTDAGKRFLEHSQAILDSCDVATVAAQRAHGVLSGTLRVVASSAFGTSLIGAAAARVAAQNIGVEFDIRLYPNEELVMDHIEFDCMVIVGEPATTRLHRQRLGEMSFKLYASQAFVDQNGTPQSIEDVSKFDGIMLQESGVPYGWNLRYDGRGAIAAPRRRFTVNEYWMAKYLAVEGLGIAYLPDFFIYHEVRQGALVPVLPEWRSADTRVYAVYPPHRRGNARIGQLLDTMTMQFDDIISEPGYRAVRVDYGQPSSDRSGEVPAETLQVDLSSPTAP